MYLSETAVISMQVITHLYDPKEIQHFKELGVHGVLLPVSSFSTAVQKSFQVMELSSILDILQEQEMYSYLLLNTVIYEHDLSLLEETLRQLKEYSFDGIVCFDYSVAIVAKKYDLIHKIIYQPGTQNTNLFDPHYFYEQGIKGITVSREIPFEDIMAIILHAPDFEISLQGHGYLEMFYSARELLTLYQEYKHQPISLKQQTSLSIEEEIRPGLHYPIYEDEHGTHIFRPKALQSFQELIVLRPYLNQFFVSRLFLSDEEHTHALEAILGRTSYQSFLDQYPHYDSGFYYKKTSQLKGGSE